MVHIDTNVRRPRRVEKGGPTPLSTHPITRPLNVAETDVREMEDTTLGPTLHLIVDAK